MSTQGEIQGSTAGNVKQADNRLLKCSALNWYIYLKCMVSSRGADTLTRRNWICDIFHFCDQRVIT